MSCKGCSGATMHTSGVIDVNYNIAKDINRSIHVSQTTAIGITYDTTCQRDSGGIGCRCCFIISPTTGYLSIVFYTIRCCGIFSRNFCVNTTRFRI